DREGVDATARLDALPSDAPTEALRAEWARIEDPVPAVATVLQLDATRRERAPERLGVTLDLRERLRERRHRRRRRLRRGALGRRHAPVAMRQAAAGQPRPARGSARGAEDQRAFLGEGAAVAVHERDVGARDLTIARAAHDLTRALDHER